MKKVITVLMSILISFQSSMTFSAPRGGIEDARGAILNLLEQRTRRIEQGNGDDLDLEILRETTDRVLTASDEGIMALAERMENVGPAGKNWERHADLGVMVICLMVFIIARSARYRLDKKDNCDPQQ